MPDAFYERDGDRYLATELTRGPWDPGSQHAGPPSALIGREIERLEDAEEFQVGRVTFEILRPVPIGPVAVEARGRPPRAARADGRGRAQRRRGRGLMRARGWRIRTAALDLPGRGRPTADAAARPRARAPTPSSSRPGRSSATTRRWSGGRSTAASSSRARRRSGCGSACPLVAGEEPSPLQRDPGRRRRRQRDQRRPRLRAASSSSTSTSPSTSSGCRRASGSASTPSPGRSRTGSAPPSRSSPTASGRIGRGVQTLLFAER